MKPEVQTANNLSQITNQFDSNHRTLSEREDNIRRYSELSEKYYWFVWLEIYEIHKIKAWRSVIAQDGSQAFEWFEDYIDDLCSRIPKLPGRRTIYQRLETIRKFRALGMSDEELLEHRPSALQQMTPLLEWDRKTSEPKDGAVSVEEFKDFLEISKEMPIADIKATVDHKLGEKPILFFGTLVPAPKNKVLPSVRCVDGNGEVFMLKATHDYPWSRECVIELGKRLEIQWEETPVD